MEFNVGSKTSIHIGCGFFPGIPRVGFFRKYVKYDDQFHEVEEDPGMSKEWSKNG
jgi:hypothetical protein